jgi:proton-translocating NADH-quinone oxidoreductase chain M
LDFYSKKKEIMNSLQLLLFTTVVFIGIISLSKDTITIKVTGLCGSFLLFSESLLLWVFFDREYPGFQFETKFILSDNLGILYHLGIDGISLFFVILSVFLLPVCFLCSWATVKYRVKEFYLIMYLIILLLIHVFTVLDLFMFYIFFESVLIPMFLMIGIWGSRDRKIHAAYQFFLYTLVGSVLMLLGIIYIYVVTGSTHLYVITNNNFSAFESRVLWLSFFASFAVKVPMIPVHIWLPEAHVEAPTAGSVLLAGILLKMGTYGLVRFSVPMFPDAMVFFQPLVYLISLIGIIYAACTTIRQVDLKKIIAYSSVGHMNFVTLGLVSGNIYAIEGSLFLMISHGLVSSALFLCVLILYYGGLVFGMPLFAVFFLIFTLANVSLPLTSSFVGEFLIILGVYQAHSVAAFLATTGVILGAVYAFWLYNRVVFGHFKEKAIQEFSDLNSKEVYLFIILTLSIGFLGIYPNCVLNCMHSAVLDCFSKSI